MDISDISNTGRKFAAIGSLAAEQHGVVSRGQLRNLGLSDSQVTWAVASGLLTPVFHGAFAVGNPAIGRIGAMRAAVLACGAGSFVSHITAAELLGLTDRSPVLIDVISPGQEGRRIDGVRWHRCREPQADEVMTSNGIPCTTVARTLVDLAGSAGERTLRELIEEAAVRRILDVEGIHRILERSRRRGAPLLRELLAPWRGAGDGVRLRSRLEARLLPRLAELGLPKPVANRSLLIDGTTLEVDFLWPEERLIVETDGEATHGTPVAFRRDRRRDQILLAAGYRVARVTWDDISTDLAGTIARIRATLEAGG